MNGRGGYFVPHALHETHHLEPHLEHHFSDWEDLVVHTCPRYIQAALVGSSLFIFLGGIAIILLWRAGQSIFHFIWRQTGRSQPASLTHPLYIRWKGHFQDWLVTVLSAQTAVGRVLVILVFLFSIGSLIIYFINCYSVAEFCISFDDRTVYVDLGFNIFFLFYFGLRFLAASDKLKFWFELNSIVDFFTITPACVSLYTKRNWLGLRFLRALRLVELPKILQFLRITRTGTTIKLSKMLCVFVSTCLTAAGFIHLMENHGDPWRAKQKMQQLSYFECLYMVMVTMSTVGYGDVVAKTLCGRIFILFFIIGGLVLFANFVPEIADIVGSTSIYEGSYTAVKGKKFIVVCGDINLHSVNAFIKGFKNQDRQEDTTEILFLGEKIPCLELETVFRCSSAFITFFHGSIMKDNDMKRVQIEKAEACLILADTCSAQPYAEDTSNIMRVLSIKNNYPRTRVIIQIIQSSNKVYLPKLPNWDWRKGDSIICFAELKLGLIAQSCVVPGLTILLTSLFIEEQNQTNNEFIHEHELENGDHKVLTELLSNDFVGMSFKDVCRLCFVKLNLMLLAIEFRSGIYIHSILINPFSITKIEHNTMGFFIAKSAAEVRRARVYCKQCHADISIPELIGRCHCKGRFQIKSLVMSLAEEKSKLDPLAYQEQLVASSPSLGILPFSSFERHPEIYEEETGDTLLDSTGMFHWCESVPLEHAVLSRKKKHSPYLRNHIVVCVFGDASSSLIGLRNFVMPLRASNFTFNELKDIVFVGSLEYLQREWEFIQNFPKLYLLEGSALSCTDLKAANIKYCAMCAILSAQGRGAGEQTLVDTKSILATLNIRSLQFKLNSSGTAGRSTVDSLHIFYKNIPIITELKIASNAQFFQQKSTVASDQPEQNFTQKFCRGTIFSDSFLDTLLCTTYHNHHILALLQTLVTGGTSPELEEHLAEQTSLTGSTSNILQFAPRNRCKLALLPVTENKSLSDGLMICFGDLFCTALDFYGILCFGLYRLKEGSNPFDDRFVICRPSTNFEVFTSDQLFCLVPFNTVVNDLSAVIETISVPRKKTSNVM